MEAPEEQRFDFGPDPEPASRERGAEELLARIEALEGRVRAADRTTRATVALEEVVVTETAGDLVAFGREEYLAIVEEVDPDLEEALAEREVEVAAPDEALSVAQFYERVRRALAREFAGEIWVTGEIRGLRESRGHHYIELADVGSATGSRGNAQQLEVVCWAREWPAVAGALRQAGVELEVGRVVRVRGKVSVWEGGSKLRFTLTALDIEALLGGIAAARRRLLAALEAENLLEANRRLPLTPVPMRIGLVTSPGSEAHRDFVGQLERSGFAFEIHLESSLVQGADAPPQLVAALGRLRRFAPDLAVVVRGGGARGDLAAFDSEEVARAIATAPFPIWTGIGHTSDRSVADEVAAQALITPTACGEAVVAKVAAYWAETERSIATLASLAGARLDSAAHRLSAQRSALGGAVHRQLDRRRSELEFAAHRVAGFGRSVPSGAASRLQRDALAASAGARRLLERAATTQVALAQVLRAFDPERQLARGWTLTRDERGAIVRSVSGLSPGERLVTRLADGEVASRIDSVEAHDAALLLEGTPALVVPLEGRAAEEPR